MAYIFIKLLKCFFFFMETLEPERFNCEARSDLIVSARSASVLPRQRSWKRGKKHVLLKKSPKNLRERLSVEGRSIMSEHQLLFSLSLHLSLFFSLRNLGKRKEILAYNDRGTTDHWLSRGSLGLMKRFSHAVVTKRSVEGNYENINNYVNVVI
ncbi:hypothetical protein PUN28_015692 [Cardiocondyla obscurior]|uniref:Uncharacterized protein n=1 Tax=Cardiocondyla obscurior TaxID=286306 RepID=A0AAW2EWL8_9HYME